MLLLASNVWKDNKILIFDILVLNVKMIKSSFNNFHVQQLLEAVLIIRQNVEAASIEWHL